MALQLGKAVTPLRYSGRLEHAGPALSVCRAEQELGMAAASKVPEAVRAHYLLAGHYLNLCFGGPEQGKANGDGVAATVDNHAIATRRTDTP